MSRFFLLLGLKLLFYVSAQAQGERFFTGAGNSGTGYSSLTNSSPWELFNNAAGVNQTLESAYFLFGYTNLYEGTGIRRAYAGLAFPWKKTGLGLSVMHTGEKDFGETLAGFSIGNTIRHVSLGMKLNYYQLSVTETKTISKFIFQFGGIAEISRHFLFGAQVFNLNQARYTKESSAYIPVIMGLGFTWKPLNNLKLHALIEKEGDFLPGLRTGIEYLFENRLWLRTGFSTYPAVPYAGLGLVNKKYFFDYSLKSHPQLGFCHHISFAYRIKQKKNR